MRTYNLNEAKRLIEAIAIDVMALISIGTIEAYAALEKLFDRYPNAGPAISFFLLFLAYGLLEGAEMKEYLALHGR